ncbi:HAMP domain-containing sensor histidine kinase [Nonomuraea insulae]|uniref:histidine kinase n=1 Tax=Nonomuraea insulae TaxID=1616787 RepID=A0ABW1CET6_9ACTN
MRRLPRSLRSQLTASVALLVMVGVALSGLAMLLRTDHRDRADLDRQLSSRVLKVGQDAGKLLSGPAHEERSDDYGGLLAGSQSLVRLTSQGRVVAQRGERPAVPLPIATSNGFTTIEVGGQTWRSLVQALDAEGDYQVQVLQDLQPIEDRLSDNARLLVGITLLATLLAGAGVWFVIRLILHPLQRLRHAALSVDAEAPAGQLPVLTRPREVADLSDALNRMLHQLLTSMQATRRFTADAGHELRTPLTSLGMNLEILRRAPDLPQQSRDQVLEAMIAEHQRITTLLQGLQTLARGDARALPAPDDIDLADLLDQAVRQARRRHPTMTYRLSLPPQEPPAVQGWPAGVRLAIDNLLDNAALHGRPGGQVRVTMTLAASEAHLTVADDGPGIPVELRERMKERFTRGSATRSDGSGLGLALVQQQAQLHGGTLDLGSSVMGGLCASLGLPIARPPLRVRSTRH